MITLFTVPTQIRIESVPCDLESLMLPPCLDVYKGEMRRMEIGMRMRDEARGGGVGLEAPVPVGKLHKAKGLYNPAPSPF